MIYYKLKRVRADGTLIDTAFATINGQGEAVANEKAKKAAAFHKTRIAVVKVTEQHLGTFGSKDNGSN